MNGIIVVNKPKGITSRDVVNKVCKILNTKKVGHTGTLDPIASGTLVLCIGNATKLVEELTSYDKEYIATVKLGVLTDTLDTTGKVLKTQNTELKKEELIKALNSFIGTYEQEVPIYSAVKINGKKLYEYARCNIDVTLPKRNVTIHDIELLDFNKDNYKFSVRVSKGTYIRSLIKDINDKLNVIGSMEDLIRIKQGMFSLDDSYTLDNIKNKEYKLISIEEVLKNYNTVTIDEALYKKIKNGAIIDNTYNADKIVFKYNNKVIAIYKKYDKDHNKLKPYKMFI